MTLVRWQPRTALAEPRTLFGEWENCMDDFFNWSHGRRFARDHAWLPRADVREEDDRYVAEFDLPGLSKGDVEVTLENDTLTISGERKFEETKESDTLHRRERFCGKFTRSLTFPGDVDSAKVDATFKDGVLRVEITKSELSKARRIEVK